MPISQTIYIAFHLFLQSEKADIAPLLDPEDMVTMKKPDWKCVFTYVQALYRGLRDLD